MKNIVILGSTGSLGQQTLKIIEKYPSYFKVIDISANTDQSFLRKQTRKFKIKRINTVLASEDGQKALIRLATLKEADIIVNVLSGTAGIQPSIAALKAGKILLLGNKESLVAGGEKIIALAAQTKKTSQKQRLIPLDSEHNAIFEILKKFPNKKIKKIILPCSGGPFLGKTKKELQNITVKEALAHPKWQMGAKISIESATLINKGFEIIEAHYLFNLPLEKIDVKIHPECRIHGVVEFRTRGEKMAYFGAANMEEYIENALLTAINKQESREIRPLKQNEFKLTSPDHITFPGIKIVAEIFKNHPSKIFEFLQKEEKIINKFLQNKIKFTDIFKILDLP